MFLYLVKQNDNLYSLSQKYRVPLEELINDNAISDPNKIAVGQSLIIKPSNFIYYIQNNDNLYQIAKRFGVSINQLLKYNPQIANQELIYPGQTLNIIYDNYNKVTMEINGYTYPTINIDILRKTLPHLTYITVFSYHIKKDGSLVELDDKTIINEAYKYKVAPLISITNINEEGVFDSDLANQILASNTLQNTLLDNILAVVKKKNYYGVNFDFEYVYPKDKENYNQFLIKAAAKFKKAGYIILTAIAPKTRSDQQGLLYEAHDYSAHGKVVDKVIIMTYEWGYTYGPAMAVAPLNKVEDVISYAVTQIPSRKILMGVPNYGYDFKVPYQDGVAADSLSNVEAIDLAIKVGAEIKYEEIAQTPYFEYSKSGQKHRVYFEDARSIASKVQLAIKYNLGGLNYWTIKDFFMQNWIIVEYYINVKKVVK